MSFFQTPSRQGLIRRPFLWIAGAQICGILAAANVRIRLSLLLLAILSSGFWFLKRPVFPRWLIPVLSGVFLLFFTCGITRLDPARKQAESLYGKTFTLTGEAISVIQRSWGSTVIVRQDTGIDVQLVVPGQVEPGCILSVRAVGIRPSGPRNPGGFDQAKYLASRAIFLESRAKGRAGVTIIKPAPSISVTRWCEIIRKSIKDRLATGLDDGQAALMNALLLGDRTGLDDDTEMDFSKSGLGHLTAVSGTHIACMLLPMAIIARKSGLPWRFRYLGLILILLVFGFVTGWRVSVTRAVFMAGAVFLGRCLMRGTDPLSILSLSVSILLVLNPLAVLTDGFWMSVSATAALSCFSEPLARTLSRFSPFVPVGFLRVISVIMCAQAATFPWTIRLCGDLFIGGILVNALATPLVMVVLWSGMLWIILGTVLDVFVSTEWTSLVRYSLGSSLDLLGGLASWAARVRVGRLFWDTIHPMIWMILGFCLVLSARHVRSRYRIRTSWVTIIALLFFAIGLAVGIRTRHEQPEVHVWFFDVGQGDSILIQTPKDETILVDGGRYGEGVKTLIPALDSMGISQLDLAIVSHGHEDHIGGITELADYRRIKTLMISEGLLKQTKANEDPELNDVYRLLDQCDEAGIEVHPLAAHDTITLGSILSLFVIGPPEPDNPDTVGFWNGNEGSIILQADLAETHVLLTADCTKKTEQYLLEQNLWPEAEILKVAHHGSGQTTRQAFVSTVKPELAIISVGVNPYGHPDPSVVERLVMAGCPVYRTDQSGAVCVLIEGDQYWTETMCDPKNNSGSRK